MKAVLVLALCLAVVHAATVKAPPCNTTTTPTLTQAQIQPYYKYSYEMAKASATGAVWLNVDDVSRSTQGLWLRVTGDASTSVGANMNVRFTLNRIGTFSDPIWNEGSLTSGDFTAQYTFGLNSSTFANYSITVGDKIWFTFFPACASCSSTVEFSVETAWYIGGTPSDNFPPIPLVNNIRSMIFEYPQGKYLPFFTVVTSSAYFYTSVVYDNKATTKSSEIVLYWTKDTPFNGTGAPLDTYPSGDGIVPGNYLTQRPFNATTPGTYYLTPYVKTGATANTDPEFTIKVGFNSIPCSSGSVLSVSLLLALLPFLASLWN
jgi:hypothetical protein